MSRYCNRYRPQTVLLPSALRIENISSKMGCLATIVCYIWNDTGLCFHDDVIKWKHFRRYWPFLRGIHRSPVNSPHKGQWRGALIFSLICAWINGWVNNNEPSDLRCHRTHYDVIVMWSQMGWFSSYSKIITESPHQWANHGKPYNDHRNPHMFLVLSFP